MSIFKIEPMVKEEIPAEKPTKASSLPESTPAQTDETPPALTEGEGSEKFGLEDNKPPMVLKVTGALGAVFTDALNKMLAVESMVMIPMSEDALAEMQDEATVPVIMHAQIMDPEVLQTTDVVEATNDVAQHPEESFVFSAESMKVTAAMSSMLHMRSFKNAHVNFSTAGAATYTLSKIKEHFSQR